MTSMIWEDALKDAGGGWNERTAEYLSRHPWSPTISARASTCWDTRAADLASVRARMLTRKGDNRALVFGASGYIGTNLVPRLASAGWRVRAAARHREVLEAREWNDVEIIAADALQPTSLDAALADVDVAYYLVHSMAAGRDLTPWISRRQQSLPPLPSDKVSDRSSIWAACCPRM